jgi:hypothetical protein
MLRVSGPSYVSICNIRNTKIHIFGDIHYSKVNSCKRCSKQNDCLTIIDYIESLTKPLDVKLNHDWLGDTIKYYKNKLYNKHKKSELLRVHYIDIRYHDSLEC